MYTARCLFGSTTHFSYVELGVLTQRVRIFECLRRSDPLSQVTSTVTRNQRQVFLPVYVLPEGAGM